jgi:hypothetical protein
MSANVAVAETKQKSQKLDSTVVMENAGADSIAVIGGEAHPGIGGASVTNGTTEDIGEMKTNVRRDVDIQLDQVGNSEEVRCIATADERVQRLPSVRQADLAPLNVTSWKALTDEFNKALNGQIATAGMTLNVTP